jgi:hypothetical protein
LRFCLKSLWISLLLRQSLSTHIHRVIHTMEAKVAPPTTLAHVRSYAHKRVVVHNLWVFIHEGLCPQNQRRSPPFPGSLPLTPHYSHVCELSTSCVDEGGELWTRTQHIPCEDLSQSGDSRPDFFSSKGRAPHAPQKWITRAAPCAFDTALRMWHITWQGVVFTRRLCSNDCMPDRKRGAQCVRLVERAIERS